MLVLSMGPLVSQARADLIGYWKLDDTSGTIAADSAGGDNDGTLITDQLEWVEGRASGALSHLGTADTDAGVEFPTTGMSATAGTVAMWGYLADPQAPTSGRYFFGHTTQPQWSSRIQLYMQDADITNPSTLLDIGLGSSHTTQTDIVELPLEEWVHVAMTWDSGTYGVFVNGEEVATGSYSGLTDIHPTANIGNDGCSAPYEAFVGKLDEVRLYNHALDAAEIQAAMKVVAFPQASGPSPKDGTLNTQTWVNISWRPGDFAVSHDVYLGDNFDDVNDGIIDTFRGNQESVFFVAGFPGNPYPDGLVAGTTYYWRIDEVNDVEPNSPWKGDIWSFSIPPKTSYDPVPADGAELVPVNATLKWTPGFGAKLHYIYFGEDFDTVNNATGGSPTGVASYSPGTLQLAKTYYWRIDEFDITNTYKGDVWSFTTEGAVSGANPANGAVDVKPTVVLNWDAGAVAASHEVYFGSDADAVKNATKASPEYKGAKALGEESYDPGKLMLNTAFYWRIDEINAASTDSPWAGNVWSFTTGDFFVIDDFEDYDAGDNQIWYSWHDGLGYGTPGTADYFAGNGTGAAVGDETTASYTEETIVHGGGKSMPVAYDNNKQGYSKYSQVDLTLTAQRDWTEEGVAELSLWFYGDSANAVEPLYVAVSNSAGTPAVVVYDDPAAATIGAWTQWIIPLQAFADQGINLSNVDKIAIGLGTRGNMATPGGSGKMYFDDIRLNQMSNAAE